MYVFFDAHTRYIAVYFGKTTTSAEMLNAYKDFINDHMQYLPKGYVEEWVCDGGPEFKSSSLDDFCREMHTRRKFIAPWNPWQNLGETAWRIILRPLRVVLASANVSKMLWPFAAAQAVHVYNILSPYSPEHSDDLSSKITAYTLDILKASLTPSPSPYHKMTGKLGHADYLRVLFCKVEVRIRNKEDLRSMGVDAKVEPVTTPGIHLGTDRKRFGAYVYLFKYERFTTASFNDIFFIENEFPPLDKIVGSMEFDGVLTQLPGASQQAADDSSNFPDLASSSHQYPNDLPSSPSPSLATTTDPVNPNYQHFMDDGVTYVPGHCHDPRCTLGKHPDSVPHSWEQVAMTGPRSRRARSSANLIASIDYDSTGTFAPLGECGSCYLGDFSDAGSGERVPVSIFTCVDSHLSVTDAASGVPQSTDAALNGPDPAVNSEWMDAYHREYRAKVANGTFTLVPRPKDRKVVSTKVAHAHKLVEGSSHAIAERKARWVGRGFSEVPGVDYDKTFTATAYAISLRMFFVLVAMLDLHTAKADVIKAFTLAEIDRDLYCEQMPGIDIPGKPRSTWVCLLHKALEGLKQSGFLWQQKHTQFIVDYGFKSSEIDPCIFVRHLAAGIIILLVWVDDLAIAYSSDEMFNEFAAAYKEAFPSKVDGGGFDKGATVFTGITVERDRERRRISLHQHNHIERAYTKFVPKDYKPKGRLVPAISDRNSPAHYSKLALAADDEERSRMSQKPYLAGLATMMYLAVFTLPVICYHCSHLGQFMHDPSEACFAALLDMIVYVHANRHSFVLTYGGAISIPASLPESHHSDFIASFGLHGYSDGSWPLRS